MRTEIKVPNPGNDTTELKISKWYKKPGDYVSTDEALLELETDEVLIDVQAFDNGKLEQIIKIEGDVVAIGEVIGILQTVCRDCGTPLEPGDDLRCRHCVAWIKEHSTDPFTSENTTASASRSDDVQHMDLQTIILPLYWDKRLIGKDLVTGDHVTISESSRRVSTYVIGLTGHGKSALLERIAHEDMMVGEGLCFLDPHGTSVEELLQLVPSNRVGDVIYWEPATWTTTDCVFGLNPFYCPDITNPLLVDITVENFISDVHAAAPHTGA